MRLSEFQQDFRAWLVAADTGAAHRLPLVERCGLAVYQNNYRGALMSCLEESYPQTRAWIGDGAFRGAAAEHIESIAPHGWTLDDYAEGFPGTLAERFAYDLEVADLARLELALSEAFIAPGAEALTGRDLATVLWDEAELRLVPSATFLDLRTNAADIWSALGSGNDPPRDELLSEPARLIVWRQDFTCCFQVLDADEAGLLPRLAGGLSFGTMCESLVSRHGTDEGIQLAGQALARWTNAGLLRRPRP
jgi:hypothetical protein